MKKQTITIIIFSIFICSFIPHQLFSQDTMFLTGNDWELLPEMFKIGYLKGLNDGVTRGGYSYNWFI